MEGITEKVDVVDASQKTVRNSSNFPLSYHLYQTQRFADITPHYVEEIVPKDRFYVRSGDVTRSFTLKAPLMSDVFKKKGYFQIPMMAILPFNWDKYYQQPKNGDDVVAGEVGPTVENFLTKVKKHFQKMFTPPVDGEGTIDMNEIEVANYNFQMLIHLESIFSSGSLVANLGAKFYENLEYIVSENTPSWISDKYAAGTILHIDQLVDLWASYMNTTGADTIFGKKDIEDESYGESYVLNTNPDDSAKKSYAVISMHRLLEMMRDDVCVNVTIAGTDLTTDDILDIEGFVFKGIDTHAGPHNGASLPLRLARLWGYKIACSHYFSNDNVDYIYSAELLRQQVRDIEIQVDEHITQSTPKDNTWTFEYNGVQTDYDYMSAHMFNNMTNTIRWAYVDNFSTTDKAWLYNMSYFRLLFSYKRSLRFIDYFTGSKPRPLAVGNIDIDVDTINNTVSAVDVTRNIQRQRFFNAVNRFGRRMSEYIEGLFGQKVAPDYHNPFYLGMTTDTLYGAEVENNTVNPATDGAEENQVVTANFKGNSSHYMFEMQFDRPCIVIGLTWYDIPRAYTHNYDRKLTHIDRFDEFNPYMQFIGDQKVYIGELDSTTIYWDSPFAYGLRHIEYKTRLSEATGGFANGSLPGWTFLAKEDTEKHYPQISPDFIRSRNDEIDDLYLSLTGYSLGTYWHFIVDNINEVEAERPMAYAPSIL